MAVAHRTLPLTCQKKRIPIVEFNTQSDCVLSTKVKYTFLGR